MSRARLFRDRRVMAAHLTSRGNGLHAGSNNDAGLGSKKSESGGAVRAPKTQTGE